MGHSKGHSGIAQWEKYLDSKDHNDLSDFLHDDVVFYSPVVFTPQRGKQITMAYLAAAAQSLAHEFSYTKKIITDTHCVYEFECKIDGKYVNGIDLMTFDEDGKCTEFKVLVRPLQAVNAIHKSMMAMLEKMKK